MVDDMWSMSMTDDDRARWHTNMTGLEDAHQTTQAIIRLHERQRTQRPTFPDLRRALERLHADHAQPAEPETGEIPEWVSVWLWAKSQDVPCDRVFPQEERYRVPTMNMSDYQALVQQWQQAGAPKIAGTWELLK